MTENAYTTHLPRKTRGPDSDVESIVWQIAHLPLAVPEIAETQLASLLDRVLASNIDADELYFLLEYIRSPLSFVREAAVRYYCAQAPMLDADANRHFQQGIEAWQRMVQAYSRCLDWEDAEHPPEIPAHHATIVQRCLFYQSLIIFEHYRAKRRLPPGIWHQFHEFYASAERLGCTRQGIRDELFEVVRVTDCQAAYIAPILLSAAKPFGHDGQQLEAIWRWSIQWAHLATISREKPLDDCSGFVISQDEDAPHLFEAPFRSGPRQRFLDTTSLTAHLERILELLERRPPPETFGLSEDNISWTQPLLEELEKAWAACHDSRRAPRVSHRATLRMSVGFDQIHALIAGQKFLIGTEAQQSAGMPGEDWFVVEESKTGCRLVHPAPGIHLQIHQLVTLYDWDSCIYRLAQIQWLMQDSLRSIVAGIALLPGYPVAESIRSDTSKTGNGRFISRAFMLSDDGNANTVTLVLPKGVFKSGRLISIADTNNQVAEMQEVIQGGPDFDLVSILLSPRSPGSN